MQAEQAPDAMSDGVLSAQLKAANGLSLLAQRKYKQAARKFVEVGAEVGESLRLLTVAFCFSLALRDACQSLQVPSRCLVQAAARSIQVALTSWDPPYVAAYGVHIHCSPYVYPFAFTRRLAPAATMPCPQPTLLHTCGGLWCAHTVSSSTLDIFVCFCV